MRCSGQYLMALIECCFGILSYNLLTFTYRDLICTCNCGSVAVIKVYYYNNIMMCNFYHKFNGPNVELGHHGLYPLYLYLLYLSHSSAHSETSSSLILCAK